MKLKNILYCGLAILLINACKNKEEKPAKSVISYVNVNDVIDADLLTQHTIPHNITTFSNLTTQQETSIINTDIGFWLQTTFKNDSIGIIVGGPELNTRITTNGGETWLENSFGFMDAFYSAAFSDNAIFVVGESEYIFKTPDYGKTWSVFDTKELFKNQFNPTYSKIIFLTDKIGFITGEGKIGNGVNGHSILLKTVDGGKSWVDVKPKGLEKNLTGIADFVTLSEKEILIVTNYGKCYKSIDGGLLWKELYDNQSEEYIGLDNIAFLDSKIGLITGVGGDLYYTDTGGENWRKIERPLNSNGDKTEFSDIVFLENSALITTKTYSEKNTRETLVYQIDKAGTNLRPFLTSGDKNTVFKGSSRSIAVLNGNVYVLDKDNLYKTKTPNN
ncbi:hypothetical protein QSV08_09765 [Maribacter sp. BPC-D8]|uniref:WD40/YVTN/BNR-like repeat-containing protein n=1 Tax=Maribacter sp. BPC-D8 TaxID=3053613 RepID=UPI002B48C594|nr:hypothetical protein [Maribacter sp. BPC-D8]WRI31522.1 hypothetical protein QSV08_09765 [Maribacter sp. BPC-D8]